MSTRAGSVVGTTGYMSPEQVRGESVDHRADIFALGCVLHELLCGQRAFQGNSNAEVAAAILSRQPLPLGQTGCDVPFDVQPIVDRCLEKSPARRFQNASDLAFALRSLITGSGSGDPPPAPRPFRSWRWAAAAAAIVAAAAVIGILLYGNRSPGEHSASTPGLNPNLVAVAPFENRTGRPDLGELGTVAADWLTSSLARIDSINVVPISLGVDPRPGATSPREVADATGAGLVVTGAYFLDGGTLRFQAILTDAVEGSLLRALDPATGPADHPMTSIESLGNEVVGAVASIFSAFDVGIDRNVRPPSFEAYKEYIAGMDLFFVDNQRALEHFTRATELDPDFVTPRLMAVSVLRITLRHAEARALIDDLSENRQHLNPFERSMLEYQRAMLDGDSQQALLMVRRCQELAPRSEFLKFGVGRALLRCARPREALEVISTMEDLGQWSGTGACILPFTVKFDAQHQLGFYSGELESVERGVEACGNRVYFQSVRARALIGMGKADLVEEVLNDGLRAPDARRRSLRLFLDIAKELDASGHSPLARRIAERGVAHAHDHLEIEEISEWGKLHYAQLLLMLERLEEAERILLDLSSEIPGDDDVLGWLGIVEAVRGDVDAALNYSRTLRDLNRPDLLGWDKYYRAAIAAHLGHSDESLGLLREAFSRGVFWNIDLHTCLELKPLRGHPEFETILHPEG